MASVFGKRYQILYELGIGGMGIVHAAKDRLTKQTVAVKQIIVPSEFLELMNSSLRNDLLLSITREFQLLASLHHPNIIKTLDYGFEEQDRPYLVLELLENAVPITTATETVPINHKIQLLTDLLEALVYLHRRNIIHHDLKPSNILVQHHNQLKVLDFGLSLRFGESTHPEGTLTYTAPELLSGQPASQASDLYAVGVIAYQIFSGQLPFYAVSPDKIIQAILHQPLDIAKINAPAPVIQIVERLLARDLRGRYANAEQVINAFAEVTGIPRKETFDIRESYLQAARFVGRSEELAQLLNALKEAKAGHGSMWLVAGESGVGKSRLLDELRIHGMVQGALVLRGQGRTEGGAGYELWRVPMRLLSLITPLKSDEASILKTIIPDLHQILDQYIPDAAPAANPRLAQERLMNVIEAILRRQTQPIMLILEDLHWAAESLDIVKHLVSFIDELPLLFIGSYRDDERPELPQMLPMLKPLKLSRLAKNAIAELSESMLGQSGQNAQFVEFLQRETEGNAFFIVEVVRALAEQAGRLDKIVQTELPTHIVTGGVQHIIQKRLERIPDESRPLLQIAAVAGRRLDFIVLRYIIEGYFKGLNFEHWITQGAAAAVFEVQDGTWVFAHDKIRDGVLRSLSDTEIKKLHRLVAENLEQVYRDTTDHIPLLAYHWKIVGDVDRALYYAEISGDLEFYNGAIDTAQKHYFDAVDILNNLIYYGNYKYNFVYLAIKLAQVSSYRPHPRTNIIIQQALKIAEQLEDSTILARIQGNIGAYYFITGQTAEAVSYLQTCMPVAMALGLEDVLLLAYNILGRVYTNKTQYHTAIPFLEKGIQLANKFNDNDFLSASIAFLSLIFLTLGRRNEAQKLIPQSLELAQNIGISRLARNKAIIGLGYIYFGAYTEAFDLLESAKILAKESGDTVPLYLSLGHLGIIFLKQGKTQEASDYLDQALEMAKTNNIATLVALHQAVRAEVDLVQGNIEQAWQKANTALELTIQMDDNEVPHVQTLCLLGKICSQKSEWEKAEHYFQQSIDIHEREGRYPLMVDNMLAFARHYLNRGLPKQAEAELREMINIAEELKMSWHLEQAQILLAHPLISSSQSNFPPNV